MGFGIYISYLDYLKGEQFITLMTMTIFVFCFIVWRPIDSILILVISYGFFFYICNKSIPATYATKVNLIIVFISIFMSAVNAFARKIKEAEKEEKLESEDDERLKDALKRFRAYGYALWLDNFGSGYSGLNVLKEYDFDMLKQRKLIIS